VGGKGDSEDIENRINSLRAMIQRTESMTLAEIYQNRITRLSSGIAIIKVGGSTEPEMMEKKHRIEDALEACKAAQEEGIVAGGGVALIRAASNLDVEVDNEEQGFGVKIILEAAKAPLRQMALNAGISPDLILDKVSRASDHEGWDFSKNELTNMIESGIIDPVKVTVTALLNATSVSSTLLTINHAILEEKA
jgi:chaperonin GroEL